MIKPLVSLSILVFFALWGCGGRVHEPVNVNPLAAFVGTWSGTYGIAGQTPTGTMTLTIPPLGQPSDGAVDMTGTVASIGQGAGTIRGYIETNSLAGGGGYAIFNLNFALVEGQDSIRRHQSTVMVDARGHLILTHAPPPNDGSVYVPDDFDLAPVAKP